jgi:hypothetical protein
VSKIGSLTLVSVLFCSLADASTTCPVKIVTTAAVSDGIALTIVNRGKLPIRRLEFTCTAVDPQAGKPRTARCIEDNALFFPGPEYTVKYGYPGGKRQAVRVTLRNATLGDGYFWKPSRNEPCQVARIYPKKLKK